MSVQRLLGLYRTASDEQKLAGRAWYHDASLEARALADKHVVEFGVAAGVIAALSPNSIWSQNLIDADTVIGAALHDTHHDEVKVSTYNRNKVKAFTIVQTGRVFPTLSGPKVTAFYANICGDLTLATVDSHAINAYAGRRVAGTELTPPAGIVREARAAYDRAAELTGETVASFQAIIWLRWKAKIDKGGVLGYAR